MIAITGGIAEGKSTVLEVLRKEGLRVLSADEVVKEIWQDSAILGALGELLGLPEPNKEAVTKKIVESESARHEVNRFFHPRVHRKIVNSDAEAAEIPLLFETCTQGSYSSIWVVTCGQEEQLKRLSARVGRERAEQLLDLQLPTRAKIPFADEVLRTNGTLADVHTATCHALERFRQNRLLP
ncbi:MAG: dephospho-CoA kinase [Chthonomonas sp.]|nr:dephospho-CoA kinase [Chthonomonas sp.]